MKKDFNKVKTISIPKKQTLEQTLHKIPSINAPNQSITKILNNVKTYNKKSQTYRKTPPKMLELPPNYLDGLKSTKKQKISSLAYDLENFLSESNKKQASLANRTQSRNNDNFGLFPVNNPSISNTMKTPPIGLESISSNNCATEINGILEISDIISKTLEVEENSILNVENSLYVEKDYSDIMLDHDLIKKQNEINKLK